MASGQSDWRLSQFTSLWRVQKPTPKHEQVLTAKLQSITQTNDQTSSERRHHRRGAERLGKLEDERSMNNCLLTAAAKSSQQLRLVTTALHK